MIKMSNEPSNALTGTTEQRQDSLDELCHVHYSNLNSLKHKQKIKKSHLRQYLMDSMLD